MDTRNTIRTGTTSNAATVQTTDDTEADIDGNGSLSEAADPAENGADNTRVNNDMDRENRDPGITEESREDNHEQANLVHNDTRNTAADRANTASQVQAAGGEQGENEAVAQAEARAWSERLTMLERTIEQQN